MKLVDMKRFSEFRTRFGKTLCRMMDYGLGREKSPKPLKIASVLLMISASDVLDKLISEINNDLIIAKIKSFTEAKSDLEDPSRYIRFLNAVGATSVGIVNFLQMTEEPLSGANSQLLIQFITSLNKSLQDIKTISDSAKFNQDNNLYFVFEHGGISEAVYELLENLERNRVIELIEERGAKKVSNDMKEAKRSIESQLESAEKAIRKKKQNKVPFLDEERDFDLVSSAA